MTIWVDGVSTPQILIPGASEHFLRHVFALQQKIAPLLRCWIGIIIISRIQKYRFAQPGKVCTTDHSWAYASDPWYANVICPNPSRLCNHYSQHGNCRSLEFTPAPLDSEDTHDSQDNGNRRGRKNARYSNQSENQSGECQFTCLSFLLSTISNPPERVYDCEVESAPTFDLN